jgi:transcriptional regulator of nitric oxide reductase
MARAMASGNNALSPKRQATAAQADSWSQEVMFLRYEQQSRLYREVLYTAKVITSVVVYFYRALAVKGRRVYIIETPPLASTAMLFVQLNKHASTSGVFLKTRQIQILQY